MTSNRMIQCYNCNEWKPGEIEPFAICDDCKKPKTKQQTLYTFGYLSARGERIFQELIAVKTPIVDVRFRPVSRHWQYNQEVIRKRPGIIFVAIPELGNEWYREALNTGFSEPHIKLHAPQVGLEKLEAVLDEYGRAAIFCACSSKKTCHRIAVADLAKERIAGLEIVHL